MENKDTAHWQNEMARLNSIIDALIAENRQLKRFIAHHNLDSRLKEFFFADHNFQIGKTESFIANDNFVVGKTESFLTDDNFNEGKTELLNPDVNFEVGKKEFFKPDAHFEVGKTGNLIANPQKESPTAAHFGILANSLRKGAMKNTIKQGRIRAAKLLLHFYEQKPGDYPTLVKLTGLSYYGLGKMIVSMKKRGWLVKDGWQQFKLTDMARKIVEDGVRGNTPPTS